MDARAAASPWSHSLGLFRERAHLHSNTFSVHNLRRVLHAYASDRGFALNLHEGTLFRLLHDLHSNWKETGHLYCPCRMADLEGDVFRDKKLVCPCSYHIRELKDTGFCKCEIFVTIPEQGRLSFVSTSIHRIQEITEEHKDDRFEVLLRKPGYSAGEVKIYVPDGFRVHEVAVNGQCLAPAKWLPALPPGLDHIAVGRQLEDKVKARLYCLNQNVLFAFIEFDDVARIMVSFSRRS